jgi:hypothetical protein
VTLSRNVDLSIDGLGSISSEVVIEGVGSSVQSGTMVSLHDSTMEASFEGEVNWSINDVVISKDHDETPWPMSGTLEMNVNRTRSVTSATLDTVVTVEVGYLATFDGSQYVQILFDDGTESVLDLTELPQHPRDGHGRPAGRGGHGGGQGGGQPGTPGSGECRNG